VIFPSRPRIPTADGENALGEKIPQRMVHLARLPRITQTAIGTALPLVEFQNQRPVKNLCKQTKRSVAVELVSRKPLNVP
jgi:hypothetical protein